MKNIMIAVALTLIVAGGTGYAYGKGSADTSTDAKERADSIAMMKEQSVSIKEMGEMMKKMGVNMQEMGMKYQDDMMVSDGKDLVMVGAKHMAEDEEATKGDDMMNQVME